MNYSLGTEVKLIHFITSNY